MELRGRSVEVEEEPAIRVDCEKAESKGNHCSAFVMGVAEQQRIFQCKRADAVSDVAPRVRENQRTGDKEMHSSPRKAIPRRKFLRV